MMEVRKIKAEETFGLRKAILRKGMSLSHEMPGDQDKETFHLGVFEDGQLICIASFMKNDHPDFEGAHFQLRGMATAEEARGKGYGRLILQEGISELKRRHIDLLWCNAREVALEFYKKLGFQIHGHSFEVDQVGTHFMMFKSL